MLKLFNTEAWIDPVGQGNMYFKNNLTIQLMKVKDTELMVPNEVIMNKIYYIRGQKVMLDSDIADLYQVETKRLKEQVKRNLSRFPEKYMFVLTEKEFECLRSQIATSKNCTQSKYI